MSEKAVEVEKVEDNYFSELYEVDVSEKIRKKNGLSYIPWASSFAELRKRYPEAKVNIYEWTPEPVVEVVEVLDEDGNVTALDPP